MTLTQKVLAAMVLGIGTGLIINLSGFNVQGSFVNEYIVGGVFAVVGKMFIAALKMLVVPLVFFSLVSGVMGIGDITKLGKVGVKSFGLYVLTTAVAIAMAITLAISVIPLIGVTSQTPTSSFVAQEAPPLADVLVNIIPSNIIEAFASGNMLQIIFFAILFGISLLMTGEKTKEITKGIEVLNEAMMKMVGIIMSAAPIAVFALLAKALSELGFDLLAQLGVYVIVIVTALILHVFGTQSVLFYAFTRLNPMILFKKLRDVQIFAFSTSSSNATIPVSLTKRIGVDNSVASFTVPFGATINMDGTAIMQGVATVFIAHIYGVELGLGGYLTVILMSVLASIGTAGVPGVGLVMLSMVFVQVGLPVEGIGLILGVDRLLDMMRTAVNVTGDAVVSAIVAKSENELDCKMYHDREAGIVTEFKDTGKIHEKPTHLYKDVC